MLAKTQIKKGAKLQIISLQDKIHTYRQNWIQHLYRMQPLKFPVQMPTSRLKIISPVFAKLELLSSEGTEGSNPPEKKNKIK